MITAAESTTPDVSSPFGRYAPPRAFQQLLRVAQAAPRNFIGKQIARMARGIYLWRAPLPADVSIGELRLRCYLRDNTGERKFVFTPWRFDPRERELLDSVLARDSVFVDIGANVGIYTLSAAVRLGAAGRVVAFEPYPPAFQRLQFNIAATRGSRRDWPRIDVLPIGIADVESELPMRIDAGNLGGGSITDGAARFSRDGSRTSVRIRCRPLYDVLGWLGIERIDALKIDIEGAEDVALCPFLAQAGDSLLPRHLVVEDSRGLWARDLPGALAGRGYRLSFRTPLNVVYSR